MYAHALAHAHAFEARGRTAATRRRRAPSVFHVCRASRSGRSHPRVEIWSVRGSVPRPRVYIGGVYPGSPLYLFQIKTPVIQTLECIRVSVILGIF